MILSEWLFKEEEQEKQTPIKNKKSINPKKLEQIARENNKMFDKKLGKGLPKKMNNPYFFIIEKFKTGFKINLESHNIYLANSL